MRSACPGDCHCGCPRVPQPLSTRSPQPHPSRAAPTLTCRPLPTILGLQPCRLPGRPLDQGEGWSGVTESRCHFTYHVGHCGVGAETKTPENVGGEGQRGLGRGSSVSLGLTQGCLVLFPGVEGVKTLRGGRPWPLGWMGPEECVLLRGPSAEPDSRDRREAARVPIFPNYRARVALMEVAIQRRNHRFATTGTLLTIWFAASLLSGIISPPSRRPAPAAPSCDSGLPSGRPWAGCGLRQPWVSQTCSFLALSPGCLSLPAFRPPPHGGHHGPAKPVACQASAKAPTLLRAKCFPPTPP